MWQSELAGQPSHQEVVGWRGDAGEGWAVMKCGFILGRELDWGDVPAASVVCVNGQEEKIRARDSAV